LEPKKLKNILAQLFVIIITNHRRYRQSFCYAPRKVEKPTFATRITIENTIGTPIALLVGKATSQSKLFLR